MEGFYQKFPYIVLHMCTVHTPQHTFVSSLFLFKLTPAYAFTFSIDINLGLFSPMHMPCHKTYLLPRKLFLHTFPYMHSSADTV